MLIVVVVIAILAAVTIVTYNGIQARATDARWRGAANDVEKAVRRFWIENEKPLYSGSSSTGPVSGLACPGTSSASGFVGRQSYQCTLEDLLMAANMLPADYISKLPQNPYYAVVPNGRLSMMFYQCGPVANNAYALYWTLKNPTAEDSASVNSILATCGNPTAIRDAWGMRSARIIQL